MLPIQLYNEKKFTPFGKQKKKTRIVLANTLRPTEYFLSKISYRFNGLYQKIPNYIVNRDGKIIQIIKSNEFSLNLFECFSLLLEPFASTL